MRGEPPRYVDLPGCAPLTSPWAGGNGHSYTTASFCGSWWDGPCIDLNEPGYALVFPTETGLLKRYYRPTDGPLALASPCPADIVKDEVRIDAIDPETGETSEYSLDTPRLPAGWNDIDARVGSRTTSVPVFKEPLNLSQGNIRIQRHLSLR